MTTIILTIIGILLAAAAALMVIFYGGDAFNGGSIGAQANTLQNAGTNVISAVQLYRGETGDNDLSDVTLATLSPNYLKEAPAVGAIGTPGTDFVTNGGGDQFFTVTGVEDDVCVKINSNLGVAQPTDIDGAVGKMGCAADGTFYADL